MVNQSRRGREVPHSVPEGTPATRRRGRPPVRTPTCPPTSSDRLALNTHRQLSTTTSVSCRKVNRGKSFQTKSTSIPRRKLLEERWALQLSVPKTARPRKYLQGCATIRGATRAAPSTRRRINTGLQQIRALSCHYSLRSREVTTLDHTVNGKRLQSVATLDKKKAEDVSACSRRCSPSASSKSCHRTPSRRSRPPASQISKTEASGSFSHLSAKGPSAKHWEKEFSVAVTNTCNKTPFQESSFSKGRVTALSNTFNNLCLKEVAVSHAENRSTFRKRDLADIISPVRSPESNHHIPSPGITRSVPIRSLNVRSLLGRLQPHCLSQNVENFEGFLWAENPRHTSLSPFSRSASHVEVIRENSPSLIFSNDEKYMAYEVRPQLSSRQSQELHNEMVKQESKQVNFTGKVKTYRSFRRVMTEVISCNNRTQVSFPMDTTINTEFLKNNKSQEKPCESNSKQSQLPQTRTFQDDKTRNASSQNSTVHKDHSETIMTQAEAVKNNSASSGSSNNSTEQVTSMKNITQVRPNMMTKSKFSSLSNKNMTRAVSSKESVTQEGLSKGNLEQSGPCSKKISNVPKNIAEAEPSKKMLTQVGSLKNNITQAKLLNQRMENHGSCQDSKMQTGASQKNLTQLGLSQHKVAKFEPSKEGIQQQTGVSQNTTIAEPSMNSILQHKLSQKNIIQAGLSQKNFKVKSKDSITQYTPQSNMKGAKPSWSTKARAFDNITQAVFPKGNTSQGEPLINSMTESGPCGNSRAQDELSKKDKTQTRSSINSLENNELSKKEMRPSEPSVTSMTYAGHSKKDASQSGPFRNSLTHPKPLMTMTQSGPGSNIKQYNPSTDNIKQVRNFTENVREATPSTDGMKQARPSIDSLKTAQLSIDDVKQGQPRGNVKKARAPMDNMTQGKLSTTTVRQARTSTDNVLHAKLSIKNITQVEPSMDDTIQDNPSTSNITKAEPSRHSIAHMGSSRNTTQALSSMTNTTQPVLSTYNMTEDRLSESCTQSRSLPNTGQDEHSTNRDKTQARPSSNDRMQGDSFNVGRTKESSRKDIIPAKSFTNCRPPAGLSKGIMTTDGHIKSQITPARPGNMTSGKPFNSQIPLESPSKKLITPIELQDIVTKTKPSENQTTKGVSSRNSCSKTNSRILSEHSRTLTPGKSNEHLKISFKKPETVAPDKLPELATSSRYSIVSRTPAESSKEFMTPVRSSINAITRVKTLGNVSSPITPLRLSVSARTSFRTSGQISTTMPLLFPVTPNESPMHSPPLSPPYLQPATPMKYPAQSITQCNSQSGTIPKKSNTQILAMDLKSGFLTESKHLLNKKVPSDAQPQDHLTCEDKIDSNTQKESQINFIKSVTSQPCTASCSPPSLLEETKIPKLPLRILSPRSPSYTRQLCPLQCQPSEESMVAPYMTKLHIGALDLFPGMKENPPICMAAKRGVDTLKQDNHLERSFTDATFDESHNNVLAKEDEFSRPQPSPPVLRESTILTPGGKALQEKAASLSASYGQKVTLKGDNNSVKDVHLLIGRLNDSQQELADKEENSWDSAKRSEGPGSLFAHCQYTPPQDKGSGTRKEKRGSVLRQEKKGTEECCQSSDTDGLSNSTVIQGPIVSLRTVKVALKRIPMGNSQASVSDVGGHYSPVPCGTEETPKSGCKLPLERDISQQVLSSKQFNTERTFCASDSKKIKLDGKENLSPSKSHDTAVAEETDTEVSMKVCAEESVAEVIKPSETDPHSSVEREMNVQVHSRAACSKPQDTHSMLNTRERYRGVVLSPKVFVVRINNRVIKSAIRKAEEAKGQQKANKGNVTGSVHVKRKGEKLNKKSRCSRLPLSDKSNMKKACSSPKPNTTCYPVGTAVQCKTKSVTDKRKKPCQPPTPALTSHPAGATVQCKTRPVTEKRKKPCPPHSPAPSCQSAATTVKHMTRLVKSRKSEKKPCPPPISTSTSHPTVITAEDNTVLSQDKSHTLPGDENKISPKDSDGIFTSQKLSSSTPLNIFYNLSAKQEVSKTGVVDILLKKLQLKKGVAGCNISASRDMSLATPSPSPEFQEPEHQTPGDIMNFLPRLSQALKSIPEPKHPKRFLQNNTPPDVPSKCQRKSQSDNKDERANDKSHCGATAIEGKVVKKNCKPKSCHLMSQDNHSDSEDFNLILNSRKVKDNKGSRMDEVVIREVPMEEKDSLNLKKVTENMYEDSQDFKPSSEAHMTKKMRQKNTKVSTEKDSKPDKQLLIGEKTSYNVQREAKTRNEDTREYQKSASGVKRESRSRHKKDQTCKKGKLKQLLSEVKATPDALVEMKGNTEGTQDTINAADNKTRKRKPRSQAKGTEEDPKKRAGNKQMQSNVKKRKGDESNSEQNTDCTTAQTNPLQMHTDPTQRFMNHIEINTNPSHIQMKLAQPPHSHTDMQTNDTETNLIHTFMKPTHIHPNPEEKHNLSHTQDELTQTPQIHMHNERNFTHTPKLLTQTLPSPKLQWSGADSPTMHTSSHPCMPHTRKKSTLTQTPVHLKTLPTCTQISASNTQTDDSFTHFKPKHKHIDPKFPPTSLSLHTHTSTNKFSSPQILSPSLTQLKVNKYMSHSYRLHKVRLLKGNTIGL